MTAPAEGGRELMPLDDYGFGPFGWVEVRFGVPADTGLDGLDHAGPGQTGDMPDWVRTVLLTVAVVALCGVVAVGLLMWRYRIPPRGLIAIGAAAIYLVSPVDVVPEVFLGPVGLLDDAGVVVAVGMFVYRLATVRRILTDGGVVKRRSGDGQRLRDDPVGDP